MTKKIVGLLATVAMLSSGVALANNDDKHKDQQTQGSGQMGSDIGGSGTQGQMQGQMMTGEKQVTGTVVKSSSNLLHLRTDNGIIPVKIDKDTQFADPNVKKVKDLKEGQQVRASFDIKGTDNVAKSISLDVSNTGGSGLEDDTGINQDMGGSGLDQDINKDKDMGGDVGGSGDVGGAGDVKE
ncbi:hypothetical protein [Archangium lansingense]|uniref:DUF5666 domain-containing protein n=1 Tax=Archangium lansingense TaxID=2995310 RepID=A0ABT4A5H3_9BACT|nr:hypothetical protein [Archangium lansinium]MCY1076222.1 hypothetical protein [Archangium lansinium]